MLNKVWPFLKAEENQNLLGWIGGGLVPSVPEQKPRSFLQGSNTPARRCDCLFALFPASVRS